MLAEAETRFREEAGYYERGLRSLGLLARLRHNTFEKGLASQALWSAQKMHEEQRRYGDD